MPDLTRRAVGFVTSSERYRRFSPDITSWSDTIGAHPARKLRIQGFFAPVIVRRHIVGPRHFDFRHPLFVIVIALAAALALVPAGTAVAAQAGNAPTAQQLAAIRAQAAAIQGELTAGAKRLDAAKAQLTQLQKNAASATAAADKFDQKLAGLRRQVAQIAGDMYEHPMPGLATTILSDDDIGQSLQATDLLRFANAGRTKVLRAAAVDGQRAKELRAQAAQDVAAAAKVQKSVAAQVAALQDKASKAAKKLEAAQAAYDAEQARLAAERAAKAKAAREAAARAAAARRAQQLAQSQAAAPCTASGSYGGGRGWGGYSDGLIPTSALCSIIGGGMLRPDAAVAFNRMSQAYARTFGHPICVTDSYRSYSRQIAVFRRKPSLAAVPGTSNHGWGLAVDLGCGIQNYGSVEYRWMTAHAGAYGWVHPAWAVQNPFEPWHWEFGHL